MGETIEDFLYRLAKVLELVGASKESINILKTLSEYFHAMDIRTIDEVKEFKTKKEPHA